MLQQANGGPHSTAGGGQVADFSDFSAKLAGWRRRQREEDTVERCLNK
jgi:hypothetical protein